MIVSLKAEMVYLTLLMAKGGGTVAKQRNARKPQEGTKTVRLRAEHGRKPDAPIYRDPPIHDGNLAQNKNNGGSTDARRVPVTGL